jgi:hypothetical protein
MVLETMLEQRGSIAPSEEILRQLEALRCATQIVEDVRRQRLAKLERAERLRDEHVGGKHGDPALGTRVKGCPACTETRLVSRHADGHHEGRKVKRCAACRNRGPAAGGGLVQGGRFNQ